MGLFLGMDEAGYGPNLGPLVIGLTGWQLPGSPGNQELYELLGRVFSREAAGSRAILHIADSKQVYSPSRGLASLELPVLSILRAIGVPSKNFAVLLGAIAPQESVADLLAIPWFADLALTLPVIAEPNQVEHWSEQVRQELNGNHVQLKRVSCDVISARRFNDQLEFGGTKGVVLSRASLALLARHWKPFENRESLVIADKHGGRNRYDELICEAFSDALVYRREESRERSRYRLGSSEIIFQTRAEVHLPVAFASMLAKYVRELSMTLFNDFWRRHCPDLRPTKGYPVDARRFRSDIAHLQQSLGVDDSLLWRTR